MTPTARKPRRPRRAIAGDEGAARSNRAGERSTKRSVRGKRITIGGTADVGRSLELAEVEKEVAAVAAQT